MAEHTLRAGTGEVRWFERYAKALLALAGSLTPAVVMTVMAVAGHPVDPTLATGICTIVAMVATLLGPANKEPLEAATGPVQMVGEDGPELDVPPREG